MSVFGMVFWAANLLLALYGIWREVTVRNRNGIRRIATPAGWVWLWYLAGVILVLILGVSPFHLIWWFPLGIVLCGFVGWKLFRSGAVRL